MLETVLEIGRKIRGGEDSLRNHRYVRSAPVFDAKKNPVTFWEVDVEEGGSFDFASIHVLLDENRQKQLFYLNYKSSDADSTKPYVFGDLYRSVTKLGEDGNFRFGDPQKKSWMAKNSFERGEGLNAVTTPVASQFRNSFRDQVILIEQFLRENPVSYIHFNFNGKGWHELEELDHLNEKLLGSFFDKVEGGYVLKAFLYKTMTSGSSRLPDFVDDHRRMWVFKDSSQAMDLLYGINYASKASVRSGDVKVVVLPRGENLTAKQIERFFARSATSEPNNASEEDEKVLNDENEKISDVADDPTIGYLPTGDDSDDFVQFDFIFSKAGGTQSDIDLVEFAGIQHSKLTEVSKRIRETRLRVEGERQASFRTEKLLPPLHVLPSFRNIVGDSTTAQKKYQSHILRVLPQIYTGTYFNDPILLPALIQKTEFNIRNDKTGFGLLKYDFYFLTRLQDRLGEDPILNIQTTPSYRIGFLLGKLAKPFSGSDSPIKSFAKNYAGLLSRRIGNLADVIKLSNDLNQKLVMHRPSEQVFRVSSELAQAIGTFTGAYDKNNCAFGFFESYFAPLPPKGSTKVNNASSGDESDETIDDSAAE